jgi:hypothetical protein
MVGPLMDTELEVEGSSHGVIWGTSLPFSGGTKEIDENPVRTVCLQPKSEPETSQI